MRRFALAAALAIASLPSLNVLFAQAPQAQAPASATAPAALPDARTIIDRHIETIGGRKAIMAHTSTRATGTLSMPAQGLSGTLELMAAKPNKMMLRITLPGIGDILEGFDGTSGWSVSPMTGPALTQGKELDQKRFDADYFAEFHDAARYVSIKTVEKTTFDGRPCYKISLTRTVGGEDFEFYDVATGLKAGGIGTRETQMGTITATETRGDYKKFGDLLQPATIKQNIMGMEQILTFAAYEYDSVPATAFDPPAAIKALIK